MSGVEEEDTVKGVAMWKKTVVVRKKNPVGCYDGSMWMVLITLMISTLDHHGKQGKKRG